MFQFEKGQKLFLINCNEYVHIDVVVESVFERSTGGVMIRCSQFLRDDYDKDKRIVFLRNFWLKALEHGSLRIKDIDIDLGEFQLTEASGRVIYSSYFMDLELMVDMVSSDWLEDGF